MASRISICNRYKELQYNILYNVYISPYICSKYIIRISPNCPKCKSHAGTRLHCLWECNTIQVFWRTICANISVAIKGQQVSASPLLCLLGSIPNFLKQHEEVIQSLILARKAVAEVGRRRPSLSSHMENYYINGSIHTFQQKWKRPVERLVKHKLNTIWKWINWSHNFILLESECCAFLFCFLDQSC